MRLAPLAAALLPLAFSGCGAPQERSRLEDQSRRVVPLPACVFHLPARRAESAGTMRRLRDTEIANLIFPSFDPEKRLLPKSAPVCTGESLLEAPELADGKPVRGGWPLAEKEEDLLYGSGGDRIKVVWLRALVFGDGTVGGPLAIVRGTERFAELYAAGPYRGHTDRVSLGTQRMGPELLVTAEDDGCTGRKPGEACENVMGVFLPRSGELRRVVDVLAERIAYAGQGERGAEGTLQYRLTSAPEYRDDGIHLVENVRITDESGTELRVLERERLFALSDKGTMASSDPPLWDTAVKLKFEKPDTPRARPPRRP